MTIRPRPASGVTPWRMAFSSTGCNSERGHRRIEGIGCQIPHHLQSILKPDLLDLEVHPEEIGLLPERNHLMTGVIQREPEQAAKAGDHLVGGLGLGVHQLRDGVEGVEQEMRLQLHLEHLEMGLGQARLQVRRMEVPGAVEPK